MSSIEPYMDESVNRIYQRLFFDTLLRPTLFAATNLIRNLVDIPITQTP